MTGGEFLTRGTIWLALVCYTAGEAAAAWMPARGDSVRRWLLTLGLAAFLAHVACAFEFHYHWSHAVAYAETARQTREFVGSDSGGGLFVNYLFGLVWLVEVAWSWFHPAGHARRPAGISTALRIFFLFMMVNGAVIFTRQGRPLGIVLCLIGVSSAWRLARKRRQPNGVPR